MTIKQFYKKNRRTIVSVLIIKAAAILWFTIPFIFDVYIAVSQTLPELVTTVDTMDKAPVEINKQISEIKTEQGYQKKDIENIEKVVGEIKEEMREKNNIQTLRLDRVIELLGEIKNGD